MGDYIKVEGTRVGADGTGYFRGSDGNYYYGNKQNGYLTETEETRRLRERKEAASKASSSSRVASAVGSSGGDSALDWMGDILSAVVATAVYISLMITLACLLVLGIALGVWPWFILSFFNSILTGTIGINTILTPVVVAVFAVMMTRSVKKVLREKQMVSRNFFIRSAVVMSVIFTVGDLFAFSVNAVIENVFESAALAILPVFILSYLEHKVTMEERGDDRSFLERLAVPISRVFVGKYKGMIFFGAISTIVGILLTILMVSSGGIGLKFDWLVTAVIAVVGALEVVMGRLAKRSQCGQVKSV